MRSSAQQPITTPQGLAAWLGQPVAIEARQGGAFAIHLNDEVLMNGRVLEFEPSQRLALAWREEENGAPTTHATRENDESLITFELARAADGGTTLVFTHRYIRAGDQRQGFSAGWHALFDALNAYLGGRESLDTAVLYEQLRPLYEARFPD